VFRRLQSVDQKVEVENCRLTKSSGWMGERVDVKDVLWIAYSNKKYQTNFTIVIRLPKFVWYVL
jgi:hypothetical protein